MTFQHLSWFLFEFALHGNLKIIYIVFSSTHTSYLAGDAGFTNED
jgi:hypothetical protein